MAKLNTKKVNLSNDHVKRVSRATPIQAIEELIWNSLDADANNISVRVETNTLGNQKIYVDDNGEGISADHADRALSFIGASWKSQATETKSGRPIHGQKGEGRFKAFSLGRVVEWDSTYLSNDDFYCHKLLFNSDNANEFGFSEVAHSSKQSTSLKVEITDLHLNITNYNFEKLKDSLTQTFANYLYNYPEIKIYVDGFPITPEEEVEKVTQYEIEVEGVAGSHQVKIIEWKTIKSKKLMLCKDNGAVLREQKLEHNKVRSLGYSFSAYLMSSYITELNSESSLDMINMSPCGMDLLTAVNQQINEHFKTKKAEESLLRLQKWKDLGIYPFEEKDDLGIIETAKREIFDIIASKVEDNLPKFDKVDNMTKKFTFKLLSQALQDNPRSMQTIITEVLHLNQDEQDDFAKLLGKTSLSSIIQSAKIVSERLDFLDALETLVFDYKKNLLERDQLHKILENEAWIFDEHFALAGSEKRLEDALKIHLKELGVRSDDEKDVLINESKQGRVDLMLSKSIQVRPGHYDYLVVELKRPSKKIDNSVMDQVMGYGLAVSDDERFDKSKCNWRFIAVSNEMDRMATVRATEKNRPLGCIYQGDNIDVYIVTWSEVIGNAKTRLKFYQDQLRYEADEETSIAYLHAKHNEFIPSEMRS